MSLPKQMTFNWRKPEEPEGRVEGLGLLLGMAPTFLGKARTLCGYEPPNAVLVTSTTDDVTCEPCLSAIGGDAVDMAERLLSESREPVLA